MDPITLIADALAVGAASGLTGAASSAVKDAYESLKALVAKLLGGRPGAGVVLARHEQAPETWRAPLMAELADAAADRDPGLVEAAQMLLSLADEAGARAGKYTVDSRGAQGAQGAQGVQVGDHGSQHNVFSAPAGG